LKGTQMLIICPQSKSTPIPHNKFDEIESLIVLIIYLIFPFHQNPLISNYGSCDLECPSTWGQITPWQVF